MLLRALFSCVAWLPFFWARRLGGWLGLVGFGCSARTRKRMLTNLAIAFPERSPQARRALAHSSARGQGMTLAELPHAWMKPVEAVAAKVHAVHGWEHIEAPLAARRPMLFVMPHLGGFEFAGRYLHLRIPMVALYRPPKLRALEPLMKAGRERAGGETFRTDLTGVRGVLRALKAGKSLIVLPDQVPDEGDGVWAPFFGRPAYTATLVARLAERTGALPILACGVRDAAGFALHLLPLDDLSATPAIAAQQLNRAVEAVARRWPEQYQWHYNRYKVPRGAPPLDGHA